MTALHSTPSALTSNHCHKIVGALLSVLFIAATGTVWSQQPPLLIGLPIEGTLGTDFFIINHVDHDYRDSSVRDYMCGWQTYDGHRGTDFALRSFRSMDSGVHVVAAAAGKVVAVVDTLPDRNKVVDRTLGFGNYIAIEHAEGYVTYYAHNRRGSALVAVGAIVNKGQRLAMVGSSGTSEDPHLHFEVWRVVDPFAGSCSPDANHWVVPPQYQTDYHLIDCDVTTWPPSLDTLRERPPMAEKIAAADTAITFWALQQMVQSTDRFGVRWRTPANETWFSFEMDAGRTSTYYYWWSWIRRPQEAGDWTVEYHRNGQVVATKMFTVLPTSGVANQGDATAVRMRVHGDVLRCEVDRPCQIRLYDIAGRLFQTTMLAAGVQAVVLPANSVVAIEVVAEDTVLARTVAVTTSGQ
jgi:murein DD-endopeptidase MepM/ murein hydrolase activator NlpD